MEEHVLIVGGGTGILASRRPECRTSVICQLPTLPRLHPLGLERHARVIGLPVNSPDEEWLAAAREVHARDPFTRVAVLGEPDQQRAARIGRALGLPAPPPAVVDAVCDKAVMRRTLATAGVEDVRFAVVDSEAELARWVRDHPGRWIVKPRDGTASAGVSRISDEAQAAAAYRRCVTAEHFGRRGAAEVLVEEFLPGTQLSVEAVSEAGEHCVVALTRKYSDPVTYIEIGHVVPAGFDSGTDATVVAHVTRVLDALGVRDGVTHTELVLTGDGPRVLETHLRMAGDEIPDLVLGVTGVDLLDCALRQLFGEQVLAKVRDTLTGPAGPAQAIWFGLAPGPGLLHRVEGLDEAAAVDPSVRVKRLQADGTELSGPADSNSRVLSARAAGPDPGTAVRFASAAVGACRLVMSARATVDDAV